MTRPIKIPGPDHPIAIERHTGRIVVTLGGETIADSRDALTLREASYPAVWYIPRKDVAMAALERSAHTSYCPYKGEASYSVFPRAARVRATRCGATRRPMMRWRRSRTTSLSTPIASIRSRNAPTDVGSSAPHPGAPCGTDQRIS